MLRVGIGGPVGSGKTALVAALCRTLAGRYQTAVVTNDIYTREDAEALLRMGVLPAERIVAVETGCCPHTAIRDDVSANLDAVEELIRRVPDLELVLIESGGDNLTATFSPALADVQLFVIDVAGGDKVPRKGGPGITRSDLLVINKTDLAPFVQRRPWDHGARCRAGAGVASDRVHLPRRHRRPGRGGGIHRNAPLGLGLGLGRRGVARRMNGSLDVRVEGTRVVRLATTPPIAAKVLPGPVGPMLMLVGSAAGLLTGDRLRIRIDLAPGSRLEVRTTAATIAHPCRDGETTALEVECHVGAGAQLVWLPEPLIACAGCRHHGRAWVRLEHGARALWLDSLTLGRTGETAGAVEQRLDVELEGRPLLREGLRLGTEAGNGGPSRWWDGPAVVGGHRHVAALHLLGRRLPEDSPGTMPLAGPGTTARFLAHRGDELARRVAAVLPRFLQSCCDRSEPVGPDSARAGERLQEAVQV